MFRFIDDKFASLRMQVSTETASGDVVFIGIDPASLAALEDWPWSRDIYARALDQLASVGVTDVFIDLDLSTPRDTAGDAALAKALEDAGGGTYLAVFQQAATTEFVATGRNTINRPIPAFADQSWPVLVNVQQGANGFVTDYFLARELDGMFIPSAGSALAGVLGQPDEMIPINFAIDPKTIPAFSFIDLVEGGIPPTELQGRKVVIGAHALELRDNFSVPVHGIVSGPILHILATETLLSGKIPYRIAPLVPVGLLWLFMIYVQLRRQRMSAWTLVTTSFGLSIITELGAILIFDQYALLLQTGVLHAGLNGFSLWRASASLSSSQLKNRRHAVDIQNTQNLIKRVFEDSDDLICVLDENGQVLAHSDQVSIYFSKDDSGFSLPQAWRMAASDAISQFSAGRWTPKEPQGIRLDDKLLEYIVTPSRYAYLQQGFQKKTASKSVATITAKDVTLLREQSARLSYLSRYDDVTGALRHHAFLDAVMDHLKKPEALFVAAFSLSRFNIVHQTLGRKQGNAILRQVVDQTHLFEHTVHALGRLDGNRFVCLLSFDGNHDNAKSLAHRLREHIVSGHYGAAAGVSIHPIIGFALRQKDMLISAEGLTSRAIATLDTAQSEKGTTVCAYDASLEAKKRYRRSVENALQHALSKNEIALFYQPQFDLIQMRMVGVEALMRWQHPTLGWVPPDIFIPIAEANGCILDLGAWALEQGCKDLAKLPLHIDMAINVSAVQMRPALVGQVRSLLSKHQFAPHRLGLELTETTLLSSFETPTQIMQQIRKLGVTWALDDFGMGYSSFGYLSQLPIQKVKLDKHFVQTLTSDPTSVAVVDAAVVLCRGINAVLLCEGVETQEQIDMLRARACQLGQGYFFGKPMPIEKIVEMASSDLRPNLSRTNIAR